MTDLKQDFVKGACVDIEERSSDATAGKMSIISEGIAAYALKDDNGELCLLCTKMAHAPNSKYRLIAPQ